MTSLFTHEFGTEQTIPGDGFICNSLASCDLFLGLSQKRFGSNDNLF